MSENNSFWSGLGGMGVMSLGGGLLSGLGSYLAGGEERKWMREDRERKKQLFNMLTGQMKQPGITQSQIQGLVPTMQRGMTPMLNRLAQGASGRLGLDSGAAQGEIARGGYGQLQQLLGGVQQKALFANQNREMELMRLMTMLGGR